MRSVIVAMAIVLAMLVQSSQTVTPPCNKKADILFILDASGSVGGRNFKLVKKFVADITNTIDVGAEKNLISLMVFSYKSIIVFPFNAKMTHEDIQRAVMKAPYAAMNTKTAGALKMAREKAFTSSNGARSDAKKVVVLLTDGLSADPDLTIKEATALKDTNVTINAVGIGSGADKQEIMSISSGEKNVFFAESFGILDNLQKGITNNVCEVPPPCRIDLLFIIDASKYVGAKAFEPEKKFLADISNSLDLGADNILISLIVSSDESTIVFPFDTTMTHQAIEQAVMNLPYKGGEHNKDKALELAKSAFTSSNGARPGAKQVYIYLEGHAGEVF